MISVGVGTGVGVNALLSRSLGEKDYDRANKAASNGVFLAVVSAVAFTILGVLIARPFFEIPMLVLFPPSTMDRSIHTIYGLPSS